MSPLLVLAGNNKQFKQWLFENKAKLDMLLLDARYIYPKSINYHGYTNCRFLLIGTVNDAGYPDEMFSFFESHNITNLQTI